MRSGRSKSERTAKVELGEAGVGGDALGDGFGPIAAQAGPLEGWREGWRLSPGVGGPTFLLLPRLRVRISSLVFRVGFRVRFFRISGDDAASHLALENLLVRAGLERDTQH